MTAQSANESKSPPHECVAGNLAHCLALYSWWLAHIGATVLYGDSPKLSRARVSDQQFYMEIEVSPSYPAVTGLVFNAHGNCFGQRVGGEGYVTGEMWLNSSVS